MTPNPSPSSRVSAGKSYVYFYFHTHVPSDSASLSSHTWIPDKQQAWCVHSGGEEEVTSLRGSLRLTSWLEDVCLCSRPARPFRTPSVACAATSWPQRVKTGPAGVQASSLPRHLPRVLRLYAVDSQINIFLLFQIFPESLRCN